MRNYLELVYFVTAGPCLLLVAIVGLRSLLLSKQAIATTETRARLTATAEQIKYFVEQVVSKFEVLDKRIEESKVTFFEKCEVILDDDGIGLQLTEDVQNLEDVIGVFDDFLPALNSLSAWCAFFVHGVADEQVAYRTLAADFLHLSEKCIPLVILVDKKVAHGDLLSLYHTWRTRFEAEVIVEAGSELLARLKQLRRGALHMKTG